MSRIVRLPILVFILTERCNCRCIMCGYGRTNHTADMPMATIRSLQEDCRKLNVSTVVFSGGEPLLHPEFNAAAGVFRDAGIGVMLLSNGLLLERKAGDIVDTSRHVIVSLDGTPEIHDHVRGVDGAFRRLEAGITRLRKLDKTVPVSGRCTVQKINAAGLRQTINTARDIGLDTISFLAADVLTPGFGRKGRYGMETLHPSSLNDADIRILEKEIRRAEIDYADAFRSGFIVESPAKLRSRIVDYFKGVLGMRPFTAPSCNAPHVSAVIEPDGTVRPCFFQPPVGNIREKSLAELLNDPPARSFRERLDPSADPVCRKCVCSLNYREG